MGAVIRSVIEHVKNNPAVVMTTLVALFGLLASFGLELTKEQTGAITALVTVLVGFAVRSQVTPTRNVAAEVNPDGDVVTGPAAPPAGDPAAVVTSEDGTGLERGAFDSGILIALAAAVIVLVGLVWLFQNL